MKKMTQKITYALALGAVFLGSTQIAFAAEPTTPELTAILQEAINDEYAARNTYQAVLDKHGNIRPFNRIVRSEENHIRAIERIAENNGVTVVAPKNTIIAPDTIEASVERAIEIDEEDIEMYDELIALGLPEDVERMFTNLQNGSRNHLAAFTRSNNGEGMSGRGGMGMRRGTGNRGMMQRMQMDEDGDGICDACGNAAGQGRGRGRWQTAE